MATSPIIEWQPIETVNPPKRGRVMLSHWSGYYCDWIMDGECVNGKWRHGLSYLTPTHWALLPKAPAASERSIP